MLDARIVSALEPYIVTVSVAPEEHCNPALREAIGRLSSEKAEAPLERVLQLADGLSEEQIRHTTTGHAAALIAAVCRVCTPNSPLGGQLWERLPIQVLRQAFKLVDAAIPQAIEFAG